MYTLIEVVDAQGKYIDVREFHPSASRTHIADVLGAAYIELKLGCSIHVSLHDSAQLA